MDDDTRVDFTDSELPVDDGYSQDSGEVVATDQEQEQQYVPKTDLDNLRRIEQSRSSKLEREKQELQAAQDLQTRKHDRFLDLATRWTAEYISQGHDAETARQGAIRNARARVEQEFEQISTRNKLTDYEQQAAQTALRERLTALGEEVMTTTGLTEKQLKEAVAGLRPDMQNYEAEVWKRAVAHATVIGAKGRAQSARNLRDTTPFVAGGSPARARYNELPRNVELGKDTGAAFLAEQKRLRRSRSR